jgi:aryl-alcohol dehydrogenase-like predicted oxidoreductase
VLATKVYGPMGPGPNNRGLSAYHIRRACEASLRRLQTDHIDLIQYHGGWYTDESAVKVKTQFERESAH